MQLVWPFLERRTQMVAYLQASLSSPLCHFYLTHADKLWVFVQIQITESSPVPAFLRSSEKMWRFLEPLTKSAAFQMVSKEKYCRDLSFSLSALWHRRRSVFCRAPCALPPRQWYKQNEKHSVEFPNPTVTSPPQRGDQETQGLSLGCYFFVWPVMIWSAPLTITGLKIETWTGLRRSFCQYMGLLALAVITTHEAVGILLGFPLYCPASRLTI